MEASRVYFSVYFTKNLNDFCAYLFIKGVGADMELLSIDIEIGKKGM
jgi:hypothetical protein